MEPETLDHTLNEILELREKQREWGLGNYESERYRRLMESIQDIHPETLVEHHRYVKEQEKKRMEMGLERFGKNLTEVKIYFEKLGKSLV
jgi:uncharacterized membrane protein YccC